MLVPTSSAADQPLEAKKVTLMADLWVSRLMTVASLTYLLFPVSMQKLSSLVKLPDNTDSTAEDVFYSSYDFIFPGETRNMHGDAGSYVIYKSKRYGDIKLQLVDPQSEGGRKLFAHYLWNASVLLAELISGLADNGRSATENVNWDVRGHHVLELGAGT